MNVGSVYRAKERMKYAGLILLIGPMSTYMICDHLFQSSLDFWFFFITFGICWSIVIYNFVAQKVWKKVNNRHKDVIIKKIIHYHKICIKSLIDEDYNKVKHIVDKCLIKYDSGSIITFFIKGALINGQKDTKSLNLMIQDLDIIEKTI